MVTLLENATHVIVTAKPDEINALVKTLRFRPDGYFFALAYQRWQVSEGEEGWDGFNYPLFKLNSTTAKALRGRKGDIIAHAKLEGFKINLDGLLEAPFSELTVEDVPPDIIKADFELDQNQRRCICDWLRAGIGFNKITVGGGKCLAKGTEVMMYTGRTKKVEDLCVGDRLMGPDSLPRRVLSLARGNAELFEVCQRNGENYTVNGDHILALQRFKQAGNWKFGTRSYRTDNVELSVSAYLGLSKSARIDCKGYKVGVNFTYRRVPLDPYFLGLWLGDGNSDSAAITSGDTEIVTYLRQFAEKCGLDVREEKGSGCSTWHLSARPCPPCACGAEAFARGYCKKCYGRRRDKREFERSPLPTGVKNWITVRLRKLKVLNNKHVPDVYRFNSRSVRLRILAGLVDSDGHLKRTGQIEITSVRRQLAEDICWLARSLGFAASIRPKRTTCQTGVVGLAYRVVFRGDVSVLPVKVKYKKSPVCQYQQLRTPIKVRPVGHGDYYGFELAGDGLFLLKDFTVTHNTACFAGAAALIKSRYPEARFIYITPSERLVRQATHEMKKFLPDFEVGQCGGGKKQFDAKDMVICTVAMLSRNFNTLLARQWFDTFMGVLYDEAHHSGSPSSIKVLNAIPAFFRLGASDTGKEKDLVRYNNIRGLFGELLNDVKSAPLIESGRLAAPHIYIADVPAWKHRFEDTPYRPVPGSPAYTLMDSEWHKATYAGPVYALDKAGDIKTKQVKQADKDKDGNWNYATEKVTVPGLHRLEVAGVEMEIESRWCLLDRMYDKAIIQFKSRNALIVEWAKYFHRKKWPCIVVATRTTHVYILEALLKEALPEDHVNILVGEATSKERDEMFEWLKATPGAVLVSPLIKEGVSLNCIRAMIVADSVADIEVARQIIGRAMRVKKEDNRAHVVFIWDRQHPVLSATCKRLFTELEDQDGFTYYHPCAGPETVFPKDFRSKSA